MQSVEGIARIGKYCITLAGIHFRRELWRHEDTTDLRVGTCNLEVMHGITVGKGSGHCACRMT